ncbi:MAG TPA: serine/threonine-protein kinase, partial [Terriglobales bacterium]|nr:serine/threonine-protein kinase [Terriglobales bacterium]
MTPEQWQQLRPILESALELDPASRASFLDGACADSFLRREVESLIASHEQAGTDVLSPSTSPSLDPNEQTQFRLPPGKRIGVYEILEEIAAGGMGAVYRAIRADGQYYQQVALKIVRSELGAEFTATRFKNERQILASLNHPNIGKILDGGTTAEGVPYFVMEFVEGRRIDEYSDANKLATTERLKLFLQICSAVQYAHQHLIIHRDIKPGNILVNAEGVPKLLDFGIAKILESSSVNDQYEQTISLLRLLTPEYASPEQVKGEPITTASDVYSLGVVLYELLTGRTPYNVPTRTPHEISRAVCEADPEKPSSAVRRKPIRIDDREIADDSTLNATPEGSAEKLSKRLDGDLDNILLMALRKEPQRRYASVEQFAQDIRRHLEHLPVIARQDTFRYRASKFITRHKAAVAVAALVTVALLSATAITVRQARIARAERARAERRFNDVRKLANSLIFEVHDSIQELPGATAARKLIIQRAQEYLDGLAQESQSDPALLREL